MFGVALMTVVSKTTDYTKRWNRIVLKGRKVPPEPAAPLLLHLQGGPQLHDGVRVPAHKPQHVCYSTRDSVPYLLHFWSWRPCSTFALFVQNPY